MSELKNLDKAVAFAGGCIAFASGAGTAPLGVSAAAGGASLIGLWWDKKASHGPESRRVLERVRERVRREFESDLELSEEEVALLEGADFALGEVLLDCVPPPEKLAAAYGDKDGFAKAAARMVISEVAARDDLFAEVGERADPLARRFGFVVIEAAMDAALDDRAYFAGFLPFVLEAASRDIGAIQEGQVEQREALERIEASNARLEALLEAFDATPTGRRARREVGHNRPFVVLARRINQEVDDDVQALTELSAMVEVVLRQQEEAQRGTNLGDLVDAALRRIAEKSRRGDFDSAAREAKAVFENWKRQEVERRQVEAQTGRRLVEANIEQNMLRRDVEAIAYWIEQGIAVDSPADVVKVEAAIDAIEEWYTRGENRGLNLDLYIAAELSHRTLLLKPDPEQRRHILNLLGIVLARIGERESATDRLEEAVSTFRDLLVEQPREHEPLAWARLQCNLANVLALIGARQRRPDRLMESAEAILQALEELSFEDTPAEWGTAQNNLGNTLQAIGSRTSDLWWYSEALTAFRFALMVRKREEVPNKWAVTQHNIAAILGRLGEKTRDSDKLQESIGIMGLVLEEWTQERVPLSWASTQANIGSSLALLGEIKNDIQYTQESYNVLQLALTERTRERVPLDWASTTLTASLMQGRIAAHQNAISRLEDAISQASEAHEFLLAADHGPFAMWGSQVLSELHTLLSEQKDGE